MNDKEKSCQGCPDRVAEPNCHSSCEYYLRRSNKHQAEVDMIKNIRKAEKDADEFIIGNLKRRNRKYEK